MRALDSLPASRRKSHGARLAARIATAALVATILIAGPALTYAKAVRGYDVTSLKGGQMFQVRLVQRASPDPGCSAHYDLSELEGNGEHTVYGQIELSGEVALRLRARALTRYGIEVGIASHDWASFALASVSLVSGAYALSEGGHLKSVHASIVARPDSWVEIDLNVANWAPRGGASGVGFAFVKLTAAGGVKQYYGYPGRGIELCTIGP